VITSYTSNATGVLHVTNTVWSDHDFEIRNGDQTGTRQVKIQYQRSSIAGVSEESFNVLSLLMIIGIVMVAAVILYFVTRDGGM
jgi:hypothetical protein